MDQIFEYFLQNHDKLLFLIAGILLVVEISVLGLSGPLLFIGIGCAVTGVFITFGWLSGWEVELLSIALISLLVTLILWKPLKKFQGAANPKDTSSDMIGQIVPVSEDVSEAGGAIRHSGINWKARLVSDSNGDTLLKDERVEICAVEGNVMIVKARESS